MRAGRDLTISKKERIMVPDHDELAEEFFAPPGAVRVSPAALKMVQEFGGRVRRAPSDANWISGFEWFFARSIRPRPDAPWEDMGPGLALGAYARSDLPPAAVQRIGGVELVIKIPRHVYESSTERLIDVDAIAPFKLVLR